MLRFAFWHTPHFKVNGIVQQVTGAPVPGAEVVAYNINLRSQQELARGCTSSNSRYTLYYSRSAFARAEKGSADLRIVVEPPPDCSITQLKQSSILYNAPEVTTINIVLGSDSVVGPSEYAALVAAIRPILGKVSLYKLVDDDVPFLVGETSVDKANLKLFIIANAHSNRVLKKHPVPVNIFYALMRQGRPTDFILLVSTSTENATVAINAAIDANIIDRRSKQDVLTIV